MTKARDIADSDLEDLVVQNDIEVSGGIFLGGTVDGRDIAADGTAQDNHIASTANPHSTTISQVGGQPTNNPTFTGDFTCGQAFIQNATRLGGGNGLALFGNHGADGSILEISARTNPGGDRDFIRFYNDGNIKGSIEHTSGGVSYLTTSDYRLKENVTPLSDASSRLMQLKPSRFNWISDPEKTVDGFLAHEVAVAVPEAVSGEKDAMQTVGTITDDAGNALAENARKPDEPREGQTWTETGQVPKIQTMENQKLVPLLTGALKEAIEKIESLEARIEALEAN